MAGHEPGHLTADLQLRHLPVEIQPVQTLHIQPDITIQQPRHREHLHHHPMLTPTGRQHQTPTRRSEAKPHWYNFANLVRLLNYGLALRSRWEYVS